MDRRLIGPIFLTGFSLLQAQILLFREFLVLFSGNELAFGGLLMIWLAATGLGCLFGGRLFSKSPGSTYYCFLPLGCALPLLTALAILRLGPFLLGYSWGEMISLPAWVVLALGALFPLCFISGIIFPWFGQLAKGAGTSWQSLLGVYLVEALGAATGGLAGLFLITWINGFPLAFCINSILAAGSYWAWKVHPHKKTGYREVGILLFSVLFFILSAFGLGPLFDQKTRVIQWKPFSLKRIQETPFGNLALAERNGQLGFFLNGLFQFSSPDPRRAEEKTHLPLLAHPRPESILLIGGGLSGTLREALKHPSIQKVDYIELDPDWVKDLSRYLPEYTSILEYHPKMHLLIGDGRRILKNNKTRSFLS